MTVYKMSGVQGELEVLEDSIVLTPKGVLGFLNHGIKGSKTIPFRSITAIQFKEAGMTSGYLQFTLHGGHESKRGILSAAQDENTFMYARKKDNATVQAIKKYVEARMGTSHAAMAAPAAASAVGLADELSKLAALRDQKLLSEEEFQSAKTRLMAGGAAVVAQPAPPLELPEQPAAPAEVPEAPKADGSSPAKRKVGLGLGLGIAFVPLVFSWFTLRKGHSTLSRAVALGWMGLFALLIVRGGDDEVGSSAAPTAADVTGHLSRSVASLPTLGSRSKLEFGNPTVRARSGMTMVAVEVTNPGDSTISCTVNATFKQGDHLLMNAVGAVNDIPAGGTRTAQLVAPGSPGGYDAVKLEADTCFSSGGVAGVVTGANRRTSPPFKFGKPSVRRQYGMTTVIVEATNMLEHETSCTVTATFKQGDTILAAASGAMNEVPPGETRTVSLMSADSITGYETIKVETDTCL